MFNTCVYYLLHEHFILWDNIIASHGYTLYQLYFVYLIVKMVIDVYCRINCLCQYWCIVLFKFVPWSYHRSYGHIPLHTSTHLTPHTPCHSSSTTPRCHYCTVLVAAPQSLVLGQFEEKYMLVDQQ